MCFLSMKSNQRRRKHTSMTGMEDTIITMKLKKNYQLLTKYVWKKMILFYWALASNYISVFQNMIIQTWHKIYDGGIAKPPWSE